MVDNSRGGGSREFRMNDGRGRDGTKPQHGRRMPAPETTGAEAVYLSENKEASTPMVVTLLDGEVVRGIIEYYDLHMIKINRSAGPNLFIRKSNIRYMSEDPNPAPSIGG